MGSIHPKNLVKHIDVEFIERPNRAEFTVKPITERAKQVCQRIKGVKMVYTIPSHWLDNHAETYSLYGCTASTEYVTF